MSGKANMAARNKPENVRAGQLLKAARDRLELTQLEMAKRLGISRQQYNTYERGIAVVPDALIHYVKEMKR